MKCLSAERGFRERSLCSAKGFGLGFGLTLALLWGKRRVRKIPKVAKMIVKSMCFSVLLRQS